ncbi:MAG: 1-acyl-sn-glycerol-3-phosphate acyltransferase [Azonexus sp.]|jgi:1-acyl-sn-glycerol-3-phosphate acyltransferase|nr:1-acyl-sn-glycerol-3-phosphate acyltransferase [Azonexus sp.]
MSALRSTLFMAYAIVWSLPTILLVILAALILRGKWGYRLGKMWRLGVQFGVRHILGIRPRLIGLENMPAEPCVILCKHQSAWETMVVQDAVPKGSYCTFVFKKELLRVPMLGWGLGAMRMISIDRTAGKDALEQVVSQGRERLQQGYYIVIFPEGTRVPPGEKRRYKVGGAYLATHVGCKVAPIAHNAGELWPRNAFLKKPGVITLSVGPAFDATGLSESEVNRRAEAWIEAEMHRLAPHRYSNVEHSAT